MKYKDCQLRITKTFASGAFTKARDEWDVNQARLAGESKSPTIEITDSELHSHVQAAFGTAAALAGHDPINAGIAIRAALLVAEEHKSGAFRRLAKHLPVEPMA